MGRGRIFTITALLLAGCASDFDPDLTGVSGEGTGSDGTSTGETSDGGTGDTGTTGDTSDGSTDDTGTTTGETSDGSTDDTGTTTGADMGTGGDPPGLGEECHFLHDQCDEGLTCVKTDLDPDDGMLIFSWACFDYTGEGDGDFGEPCADSFECANGYMCMASTMLDEPPLCDTSNGNDSCCTPYCESDDDCPNGLHCYYLNIMWDMLDEDVQQYGWPRICVDDTWPQKTPP